MANEYLNVYCKLPNGLTMCLEVDGEIKRVTLPRSAKYIQPHPNFKPTDEKLIVFGSTCTPVAKDFWEAWKKKVGAGYAPLKNGMAPSSPVAKVAPPSRASASNSARPPPGGAGAAIRRSR